MSEPVYELSRKGAAEMRRLCAEALFVANNGIEQGGIWRRVTPDEVRAMYYPRIRAVLREAMAQVDPDSPIAIRCNNCRRVSSIPRHVKTFNCHCSPFEEQWVVKSRFFDMGVEGRVFEGGSHV